MRLATWNCYQGTDRKVPALLSAFQPDIAVIPESSMTPAIARGSLLGPAVPHAWVGDYPNKGLGIYAPGAEAIEVLSSATPADARHGLAVTAHVPSGSVTVLGIWTQPCPVGSWKTPYMNALSAVLAQHDDLLSRGDVVVAGDVNCSAQSSPEAFRELLDHIKNRYGLRSAYHQLHDVEAGTEPDMTLWWRGKEDAGFHCDLVLVPEAWTPTAVTVGSYSAWGAAGLPVSSDHAPVVADLERVG